MTRKLYRFIRVVPCERNYRNENQVCGINGSWKGFYDFQAIDVGFRFDYFFYNFPIFTILIAHVLNPRISMHLKISVSNSFDVPYNIENVAPQIPRIIYIYIFRLKLLKIALCSDFHL